MNPVGEIVEILGEKHVLIKSHGATLKTDALLTVFSRVTSPEIQAKYSLAGIDLPKGELRIIADQGNQLYLGEAFRPMLQKEISVNKGTILSGIFGNEYKELRNVPGAPSARLSLPTLPVNLEEEVVKGDFVSQ